jgi:hypothetical protein
MLAYQTQITSSLHHQTHNVHLILYERQKRTAKLGVIYMNGFWLELNNWTWLEHCTGIAEQQVRFLPRGLQLYFSHVLWSCLKMYKIYTRKLEIYAQEAILMFKEMIRIDFLYGKW